MTNYCKGQSISKRWYIPQPGSSCVAAFQFISQSFIQRVTPLLCQSVHYFISSSFPSWCNCLSLHAAIMLPISHFHRQDMYLITSLASLLTPPHTHKRLNMSSIYNSTTCQSNWLPEVRVLSLGSESKFHLAGFPTQKRYAGQSSGHQGNSKGVVATRKADAELSNSC